MGIVRRGVVLAVLVLLASGALPLAAVEVRTVAESQRREGPDFITEGSYLAAKGTEDDQTALAARIVQSLSTMEGIRYFSHRRNREMVLYSRCCTVDGPETRRRIPDFYDTAPGNSRHYLLEDSSFGECLYRAEYRETGSQVEMTAVNVSALKYGIFTGVSPEKMTLHLTVRDLGSDFLVHALIRAEIRWIPFAGDAVGDSISARLKALVAWFTEAYNESFKNGHL
ncbi:MAG: hypothetical protein LBS64_02245 [Spirochaetaceae bacterium]|nr:hypothetical protein [Spirochaetaceae bacterium]